MGGCDSGQLVDREVSDRHPQPPPRHRGTESVWQMVIEDMLGREAFGIAKYGGPLEVDDGRDSLEDLYDELLDACCYIRKEIERRKMTTIDSMERPNSTVRSPGDRESEVQDLQGREES